MCSDMDRSAAEQKAAAEQQRYAAQVAAYARSPVGRSRAAAFQQAQTRIPQLQAEAEVLISSVLGKLKARQYRTPPGLILETVQVLERPAGIRRLFGKQAGGFTSRGGLLLNSYTYTSRSSHLEGDVETTRRTWLMSNGRIAVTGHGCDSLTIDQFIETRVGRDAPTVHHDLEELVKFLKDADSRL
jgi:hypothetical protein